MTDPGLSDALQTLITRWREQSDTYEERALASKSPFNRGLSEGKFLAFFKCAQELATICTRVAASHQPDAPPADNEHLAITEQEPER